MVAESVVDADADMEVRAEDMAVDVDVEVDADVNVDVSLRCLRRRRRCSSPHPPVVTVALRSVRKWPAKTHRLSSSRNLVRMAP